MAELGRTGWGARTASIAAVLMIGAAACGGDKVDVLAGSSLEDTTATSSAPIDPRVLPPLLLYPSPIRVYDSRVGIGRRDYEVRGLPQSQRGTVATLEAGDHFVEISSGFPKGNVASVQDAAKAYLVNITVIPAAPSGWLAVFGSSGYTGTSTVNWSRANEPVANETTAAATLGGSPIPPLTGGVSFRLSGEAHVVIDLIGAHIFPTPVVTGIDPEFLDPAEQEAQPESG